MTSQQLDKQAHLSFSFHGPEPLQPSEVADGCYVLLLKALSLLDSWIYSPQLICKCCHHELRSSAVTQPNCCRFTSISSVFLHCIKLSAAKTVALSAEAPFYLSAAVRR